MCENCEGADYIALIFNLMTDEQKAKPNSEQALKLGDYWHTVTEKKPAMYAGVLCNKLKDEEYTLVYSEEITREEYEILKEQI